MELTILPLYRFLPFLLFHLILLARVVPLNISLLDCLLYLPVNFDHLSLHFGVFGKGRGIIELIFAVFYFFLPGSQGFDLRIQRCLIGFEVFEGFCKCLFAPAVCKRGDIFEDDADEDCDSFVHIFVYDIN